MSRRVSILVALIVIVAALTARPGHRTTSVSIPAVEDGGVLAGPPATDTDGPPDLRMSGQRPAVGGVGSPRNQEPTQDISTALEAGLATWFNSYGFGLYAAVPSYSWGDPRYRVTVCRQDNPSRCVVVTVLDCLCGGSDIIIDLSRDAFARLEDPSRGKVAVTVESGGPTVTLPPTDIAP